MPRKKPRSAVQGTWRAAGGALGAMVAELRAHNTPARLFVGSFVLLVTLGTVGFRTLPGLYTGEPLGWIDALFTATSAICVTGLVVVDTATRFTFWGQAYVVLLIQLGGLGVIAFTTAIIYALGGRPSLHHEKIGSSATEIVPHLDFRHLVRDVLWFTFLIELAGAVLLALVWIPRFGWAQGTWHAVFHSVSAFCNAGFSTFSDNLMGWQRSPFPLIVVMGLIVVGGIGFLTLEELYVRERRRVGRRRLRLSLHSRLVLGTTAVLILGGAILATVLEWSVTLRELPPWIRVVNGFFISVTARTAGFNSVDYAQTSAATDFLTILLMSIGGSPGSTAGGIKTTTFAVLGLLAWSRWRGRPIPGIAGRSLPEETIGRAIGLVVVAFGLVTLVIFVLTITEIGLVGATHGGFLAYMFESASAFNTVGLSMGVTAGLSSAGRLSMVFLMFVGRVGPLGLAAAISRRPDAAAGRVRYAYEDVIVG